MSGEVETTNKNNLRTIVRKRYGEFMPRGSDTLKIYRQWTNAIFGSNPVDDAVMYFVLSTAKFAGIDPRVPRQIYAVPYNVYNKASKQYEQQYNIIIGIEGFVTIAENTKQYGGTTKPEYEFGADGDGNADLNKVISCTIGVYKIVQGVQNISYQTVYFDEYDTGKNLWKPSSEGGKPKTMIKKVALAHALRASFSACAGLYIEEEMEKDAVIEGQVIPPTPDIQKRIDECKTAGELQSVLDSLSPEEKLRAQPFLEERFKSL